MYQAHSLSFLSMPREVKSLPGIPPSPAPAVATFSQAPSQPQPSQTLAPLAVQAAPQVRATQEAEQRALGRSEAWDSQRGVATGSGNFTGRTGKGLWLRGGLPLRGTPDLSPTPDQAYWEDQMCVCQVISPARTVGRDNIDSLAPQASLFNLMTK